jgi:glycerophosphoryl diester phosphodiesterase
VNTTKIVGHRGAKGLEHENTIKGFKLAKSMGVDAIELDVMATKDGKFVVFHDYDLKRLAGRPDRIADLTYAELAEIHLSNQETIPLLYDVLSLLSDIPVIMDVKTPTHLEELYKIIDHFDHMDLTVTAWLHPDIVTEFKRRRPKIPAFIERQYIPLGHMHSVRKRGADGLNLYYPWLNPITYWLAKRRGLQIQVYTIDKVWHAKLIKKFYPGIWICSNYPDRLMAALK